MSDFPTLTFVERELRAGVLTITLNRPEAKNALSNDLRFDLRTALLEAHDAEAVRCIVLTGAGDSFCAGGDVKGMGKRAPIRGAARIALGRELIELLRGVNVPTIAAVRGHAVGAGFGLALGTDLIIASDTAKFQLGFVKRGLAPDSSVPYFLAQQIGARTTMYYAVTGEIIDSAKALDLGIAVQRYADEEFSTRVQSFAETLAAGPTAALYATRKVVHAASDLTFAQTWDFESFASAVTSTTRDHMDSVAAFKSKTTVEFHGE